MPLCSLQTRPAPHSARKARLTSLHIGLLLNPEAQCGAVYPDTWAHILVISPSCEAWHTLPSCISRGLLRAESVDSVQLKEEALELVK